MAASGNTNPGATEPPPSSTPAEMEEVTARQANKRYEGLLTVRSKAVKGKGAWYWAHLEPLLVRSSDTGLPTAVKLKCCLCDAVFSASNPSRTASEHLTRGACPNFISSAAPLPTLMIDSPSNQRKRSAGAGLPPSSSTSLSYLDAFPLAMVEPTTTRHSQELLAAGFSPSSPSPSSAFTASMAAVGSSGGVVYPYHHLPQQQQQQQQQPLNFVLSGGKEDWGALAMLKDNVKRLKSPHNRYKPSSSSSSSARRQGVILTKEQIDSALDCLADWVYDSYGSGSVPLSSVEHPKFKTFLTRVGLPPSISIIRDFICGSRLDSKYQQAKADAEAKIRDSMLFQISTQGWNDNLVIFTVNLPNGTSVFRRALLIPGTGTDHVPPEYKEDVLWETVQDVSSVVVTNISNADDDGNPDNIIISASTSSASSAPPRCAGIVGDCRFRNKLALRNLEKRHPWMVNLSCQYQGFSCLVNDLYRELPLFHNVADNCRKIAGFVNNNTQLRSCFLKYRIQELGESILLRVAPPNPVLRTSAQDDDDDEEEDYGKSSSFSGGGGGVGHDFEPVFSMLEDIAGSIRVLQLVLLDDSYTRIDDSEYSFREFRNLIRDSGFWNDLEAVRSLVKLIKETASEVETERPLVGQCLPIWEDLRAKVNKDWLGKFHISESTAVIVERVISRRFEKNYHPAWAAAYILDPVNLIRDGTGKYLPPFKHLTTRQEKDVDRLVTRLASSISSSSSSSSEAPHVVVLMELMKWRTEGLDPDYAQAVQLKQRDPVSGKMRIAIPQSSRLVWETYLTEFKALGKVAVRLVFLHATATSPRGFNNHLPPPLSLRSSWLQRNDGMDPAALEKIMFIAANSKLNLERRDIFAADQDKDAHLFAIDHMSESGL